MKSALLVFLLAWFAAFPAMADDPSVPPVTDPAQVAAHFRQVAAGPAYQETEEPTLNSRFSEWLSDWFKHLGSQFGDFKYASRMPAFESMLMSLLVIFCIAVLLYIMVRLTKRRAQLDPPAAPETPRTPRAPESYDGEIGAAIDAGDWHAAWLASWRQFLARLEHRRLVDADRTRTNREYLAQLQDKPLPASAVALLSAMVDTYDHFIYGRTPIGEPDWTHFHRQIDEAVLLLHLDARRPAESSNGAAA